MAGKCRGMAVPGPDIAAVGFGSKKENLSPEPAQKVQFFIRSKGLDFPGKPAAKRLFQLVKCHDLIKRKTFKPVRVLAVKSICKTVLPGERNPVKRDIICKFL